MQHLKQSQSINGATGSRNCDNDAFAHFTILLAW
jgi:hypothetical protein